MSPDGARARPEQRGDRRHVRLYSQMLTRRAPGRDELSAREGFSHAAKALDNSICSRDATAGALGCTARRAQQRERRLPAPRVSAYHASLLMIRFSRRSFDDARARVSRSCSVHTPTSKFRQRHALAPRCEGRFCRTAASFHARYGLSTRL